jgi:hypothetical protein
MPDLSALLALLREAIKANPRLQLALGVAGVGAVVAIVLYLLGGDRELAVVGGAFVVGFMILLSVFITITSPDGSSTRPYLATFLIWATSLVFVISLVLVVASYFVCWPQPFGRSCNHRSDLSIRGIDFVSEAGAKHIVEGTDSYYVVPQIVRRSNREFHMQQLDGAIFFIAFVVDGFVIASDGSTNVEAEVVISTNTNGLLDIRSTGPYAKPLEWQERHIPKFIKPDIMLAQFRSASFDIREHSIPIVVALGCMHDTVPPVKTLTFLVTVFDAKARAYARQSIEATIVNDSSPPQTVAQDCHSP